MKLKIPGSESSDLLLHTVSNSWVHGGSSGKNSVGVQIFSNVNVALHNRVVRRLVNAGRFHPEERRLKHTLNMVISVSSDCDAYQNIKQKKIFSLVD